MRVRAADIPALGVSPECLAARKERLARANQGRRALETGWGYGRHGATTWEDALQEPALGLTRWWLGRKAELASKQLLRFLDWAAEELTAGGPGGGVAGARGQGASRQGHGGGEANDGGQRPCAVCRDAAANTACVPCGHQALCLTCAGLVLATDGRCPLCRAEINNTLRIYS